jgi:hypothetical protein
MNPPTNLRVVDANGFNTTSIFDGDGYLTHVNSASGGVTGYDWEYRINGGSWFAGSNSGTPAADFQNGNLVTGGLSPTIDSGEKYIVFLGIPSGTIDVRVRATNGAGTTSAWVQYPQFDNTTS